jgi:SAM-dependent methyltransferase
MLLKVWKMTRRFVPVRLYPFLAPIQQWRRRGSLARLQEADRRYLAEHSGICVPPAELRYNVVGACTIAHFLDFGERTVDDIENALKTLGRSLDQCPDFLDFGCGCGRLILALNNRRRHLRITGCDVDARAIDWCSRNIDFAKFVCGDALPPSPFPDQAFDLVWAGSVFTHLDEERQDRWLEEMQRILRPGGILLASVHGPHCWQSLAPAWTLAKLKRQGMMFVRTATDEGIHPDWYQTAWHTERYIRQRWGDTFEICNYIPRGFNGHQDLVVARKRDE